MVVIVRKVIAVYFGFIREICQPKKSKNINVKMETSIIYQKVKRITGTKKILPAERI